MRILYLSVVTISLRNLPPDAEAAIVAKSKKEGISLNQAAQRLILAALDRPKHNADFDEFCGLWSAEQGDHFQQVLREMRQVDRGVGAELGEN